MWTNQPSIQQAQSRVNNFKPEYCANPACLWHLPEQVPKERPFVRFGAKKIQRFPYLNPRFRCRKCRKTFSASFFTLQYRDKRPDNYEEIFSLLLKGASKCAIAEEINCSEDTVRRRKRKIVRWALLEWAKDLKGLKISEAVAFDGLENFAFSQFDPNNLNHAVGKKSFFVYDFNLSAMNRKGRMSPRQKKKKKHLEELYRKYPGNAIEKDSLKIFTRLLEKSKSNLTLHTDDHHAYRRALKSMPDRKRIFHMVTPSKVGRNFRNRLFPINHTDMLTRHQLCDFKRETIAFAKTSVGMLGSFVLLATHKNYMRTRFKKPHVRDPMAHLESPAMHLGLRKRVLGFKELFRKRISVHHVKLSDDWLNLFDSTDTYSRRTIRPYAGI